MAKENNVTCPKCDADIPKNEIEDGRCKCGFNLQMYIDRKQVREVEEKERKAEESKNPPPAPAKKKGLFGTGLGG